MDQTLSLLRQHGIRATPQRIAVARYVLGADLHPTADQVWQGVRRSCPTIARATVYNSLNLLVAKGLLVAQVLREGTIVFDCHVRPHHHFVDTETGVIYDIPWGALRVTGHRSLEGFEVHRHHVVMRGRRRKSTARGGPRAGSRR